MSDIKGILAASKIGKKKQIMGTEEEADDELEKSGISEKPSRVGKPPIIDDEKIFRPQSQSGKQTLTRASDDATSFPKGSVLNQMMDKSAANWEDSVMNRKYDAKKLANKFKGNIRVSTEK